MIRLAVFRSKLIPQSPRIIFLLSLLFLTSLVSSCSSAPKDAASGSSPSISSGGSKFEGTITAKMFPAAQPIEVKYAIKGSRMRVETQLAQGGTQTGVVLMDSASSTQTMLMPQTKTYMSLDLGGKFQEIVKDASKNTSFKATSTGKTEAIAGHTCEHWLMGDKQEMDVCLAKGLGYFGGGGQSGGIFDQLKNLGLGDKAKAMLDANPEFAKFVQGGAFPLKIAQVENGQSKTILEVTSVEQKPLDDSLFNVPPDYKKMEIPGMPGKR